MGVFLAPVNVNEDKLCALFACVSDIRFYLFFAVLIQKRCSAELSKARFVFVEICGIRDNRKANAVYINKQNALLPGVVKGACVHKAVAVKCVVGVDKSGCS